MSRSLTFIHLADAFIQSNLKSFLDLHFISVCVCVFSGNQTHDFDVASARLFQFKPLMWFF